jgi:hypothetical protein
MDTIQTLFSGLSYPLRYFQHSNSDTQQIMDPLSCIIRLGILHFKEEGTKISLYYNKITFQTPTILQGTKRWSNGDNRNDLHNLYVPIKMACNMFNPHINREIADIFSICIKGLTNLQKSYKKNSDSNLVIHCLNHYINIITEHLTIDVDSSIEEEDSRIRRDRREEVEVETLPINFEGLWTNEEIHIIHELFVLAEKKRDRDGLQYIINSMESILEEKDNNLQKMLQRLSTL